MSRLEKVQGFTPELIGRTVVVVVLRKKEGTIDPDSGQRTTGTLKAYYKNDKTNSGSFIVDGYSPRQFGSDKREVVNVYVYVQDGYIKRQPLDAQIKMADVEVRTDG